MIDRVEQFLRWCANIQNTILNMPKYDIYQRNSFKELHVPTLDGFFPVLQDITYQAA